MTVPLPLSPVPEVIPSVSRVVGSQVGLAHQTSPEGHSNYCAILGHTLRGWGEARGLLGRLWYICPCAQASERGWGKEMEEAEGEEREEKIEDGGKKERKGRTGRMEERGGEGSKGRESSIKITEGEGIVKALCPLAPQTCLGDLCTNKSSA